MERIKKEEEKVNRIKMVYKEYNKTCDFGKFKTIHVFGNKIRNNIINMHIANDGQNKLANYI